MLTSALVATVLTLVYGLVARVAYAQGYHQGHQDGQDHLADEWMRAACRAPDAIDRGWPTASKAARPS